MKKNNKQRLFEVMEAVNSDFKTSSDHFREINQIKNDRKKETAYTSEENIEIGEIINELKKIGLEEGSDNDYWLEKAQDQMGTKTPRFEFRFFINKLKDAYFQKMKRHTEATLCQASRGAYTEKLLA